MHDQQTVQEQATLPLQGRRILVTRASEQAGAFSAKLRALGAMPVEFPSIRIVPPEDWAQLDGAFRRLYEGGQDGYDWLIFTSANGVRICCERLLSLGYDPAGMQGVRIAAIGPATAAALKVYHAQADLVPDEYIAEHVASALIDAVERQGGSMRGQRILLARAAEARDVLMTMLREAGASVDVVAAYVTVSAGRDDERCQEVLRMLRECKLDVLTFTSSSTVRHFVAWLTNNGVDSAALSLATTHPTIACIGPVTAQTARTLGLPVHIEAVTYTIDGLIEAIVNSVREIA